MRSLMPAFLCLVLSASTACTGVPCGERVYGGGELVLSVEAGSEGGTTAVDGAVEAGDGGAQLVEPADSTGEHVLRASVPDPGWAMFPDVENGAIDIELRLRRDPPRAEVILVEWSAPTGEQMHVTVADLPQLTWDEPHRGRLVIADMPWESCEAGGACTDVVASTTTTVEWTFDATPIVDTVGDCE